MVVGERVTYKGPFLRQPGKKILTWVGSYLVGKKIPDINSGFRLINKQEFFRFIHLYPNSFSLSTTTTLAFFKDGLTIKYVPIKINPREKESKSTVKPFKHGLQTLLLILRVIMLFNPLKIFIPLSMLLLASGFSFSLYGVFTFGRFPVSGLLIIITGFLVFFNGLLADQISTLRRG